MRDYILQEEGTFLLFQKEGRKKIRVDGSKFKLDSLNISVLFSQWNIGKVIAEI